MERRFDILFYIAFALEGVSYGESVLCEDVLTDESRDKIRSNSS